MAYLKMAEQLKQRSVACVGLSGILRQGPNQPTTSPCCSEFMRFVVFVYLGVVQ